MSSARRVILTVAGFAALELVIAIAALATIGAQRISFFLLACGVATAALARILVVLLRPRPGGGGGGGLGDESPGPPEPPWWPDFERQLRDHVRTRERQTLGSR